MSDRPKPPEGYETWLDGVLSGNYVVPKSWQTHARAELAELREKAARIDLMQRAIDACDTNTNNIDVEAWAVQLANDVCDAGD